MNDNNHASTSVPVHNFASPTVSDMHTFTFPQHSPKLNPTSLADISTPYVPHNKRRKREDADNENCASANTGTVVVGNGSKVDWEWTELSVDTPVELYLDGENMYALQAHLLIAYLL